MFPLVADLLGVLKRRLTIERNGYGSRILVNLYLPPFLLILLETNLIAMLFGYRSHRSKYPYFVFFGINTEGKSSNSQSIAKMAFLVVLTDLYNEISPHLLRMIFVFDSA